MPLLTRSRLLSFGPVLVACITLIVAIVLMVFYLGGELRGNINWSVLPSNDYDIPDALVAKGFEPLYVRKGASGWDGQFYYYIANDLLAQTDAKYKVEMAPYRYQRIGVAFIAKMASLVLGYDYVPVTIFYGTSLLLVIAASFFLATFFQRFAFSPYLALLWSLAAGTQMTVLNGLPDAAGDALLLMALIALLSKRPWLYMLGATLCVLSREVYILFPLILAASHAWQARKTFLTRDTVVALLPISLPVLFWTAWQAYLKLHFADVPAVNVIKEKLVELAPLASWSRFTTLALGGVHPIFHTPPFSYLEPFNLLSFILLLFLSFWSLFSFFQETRGNKQTKEMANAYGIMASFLLVFVIYLFFGNTVMRHYTGFLKTISICYICIILSHTFLKKPISRLTLVLMFVCFIIPQATLVWRVAGAPSSLDSFSGNFTRKIDINQLPLSSPCVADLNYTIQFVDAEDFFHLPLLSRITGQNEAIIFHLRVTNKSHEAWQVSLMNHGFLLLSTWKEKEDGRFFPSPLHVSMLQKSLPSGEERIMPIIVSVPDKVETKTLNFSIQQDGCPITNISTKSEQLQIEWKEP